MSSRLSFVYTGLAIFAMFFGAGNVVFPLNIGQMSAGNVYFAIAGLTLTGIIIPLMGLISMISFNGDYYAFFNRLGKIPGLICILLIMGLIGPFGGMPRTITLAYSTFEMTAFNTPFWLFNLVFCALIALLAYRRDAVLTILGKILTPLLLAFLAMTIIVGFITPGNELKMAHESALAMFNYGFLTGYNTMDMLAALFFSTVVLAGLHAKLADGDNPVEHRTLITHLLKAILVAGVLMFLVYGGFCLVAARHAYALQGIPADELLGTLTINMLGNHAGLLANGVVTIACLTTAVTLASVFAEFLSHLIYNDPDKMYKPFVLVTTLMAFCVSFIGFMKIVMLIYPFIAVAYPFLIVLAILNLAHRMFGLQTVKIPVLITLIVTLWFMYFK